MSLKNVGRIYLISLHKQTAINNEQIRRVSFLRQTGSGYFPNTSQSKLLQFEEAQVIMYGQNDETNKNRADETVCTSA